MDYTLFVILAPLTALAAAFAIAKIRHYRSAPGANTVIVLLALTLGWLLTNTLAVVAPTAGPTLLWAKATYFFSSLTPVAWLFFALDFTGRRTWVVPSRIALFTIIPLITLVLAFTNEQHALLWTAYAFIPSGPFLSLQVSYGIAFWVQIAHAYALMVAGSVLIIREYITSSRLFRRQSHALLIAAVVPFVFNIIYVFRLIPHFQKDYSPFMIALSALVLAYTIRSHGLFELKPVARNLLVDSMNDGMLVLDEQHRIVDINPAACHILGASHRALLGQPISAALPPDQCDTLHRFRDHTNVYDQVTLDRNGVRYHYEVRVSLLDDDRPHPAGRLVLLHDITDRREAEAALRQANEELHARNEELDAFAHTVAHDLNSPLQGIIGFSGFLYADLPDPQQRELAHHIMQTGSKMHTILQELMLFAGVRKTPVTLKPLDMPAILTEAMARLKYQIQQHGAHVTVQAHWPKAMGYAPWIEEVWVNYLNNALKYGGEAPHIELGGETRPDGSIRFWVRDKGPGIAPDDQAQLFVPFSRIGSTQSNGHGLGLSIVQRIVQKLQGEVGVESTGLPGEGSQFYFTLPAAPPATQLPTARIAQPVEATRFMVPLDAFANSSLRP